MLNVTVGEIMSEILVRTKEDANVGKVAHLLLRHRIEGILIVKNDDEHQLIGIFTTQDLLNLVHNVLTDGGHRISALDKLSEMPVGKITSKDTISLQRDAKVAKAIAIMSSKNVHTIPIYDKDKLVGVVGRHDILNATFYHGG